MKIGNHRGKLAIAGLAALFLVACVAPLPGFERIDPPEYSGAIPLQPEAGTGGGGNGIVQRTASSSAMSGSLS